MKKVNLLLLSIIFFTVPGSMVWAGCETIPNDCDFIITKLDRLKKCLIEGFERIDKCIIKTDPCSLDVDGNSLVRVITTTQNRVISESGVYCVTEDISETGTSPVICVNPDVSNVTIDLNNHKLTGDQANEIIIQLKGSNADVTIFNGILERLNVGGLNTDEKRALEADGATNLTLEGIDVTGDGASPGVQGFVFDGVQSLRIKRCRFSGLSDRALILSGTQNGKIFCCQLFECVLLSNEDRECVLIEENSNNLLFEQFNVSDNTGNSLLEHKVINVDSSNNIIFLECNVSNNIEFESGIRFGLSTDCLAEKTSVNANSYTSAANGLSAFRIEESVKIVCDSCIANDNSSAATAPVDEFCIGFNVVDTSTACCILDCFAKQNGGVDLNNGIGYNLSDSANCYFKNNVAIANNAGNSTPGPQSVAGGFNWDGVGNNVFFSNFALSNGTTFPDDNYFSGGGVIIEITFDPSTGNFSATPVAWDNISAPDTIP